MPNTREKPMGRLTLPHYGGNGHYMKCSEQFGCSGECADCEELDKIVERLAYYEDMIANGVTVQKWIPLTEQKPDRDELVIVFFEGMRDTNCAIQIMYGWCLGGSASHWMPLPEPPKGE